MLSIGFDFDGCFADLPFVQDMAWSFMAAGNEVHIITYRHGDENDTARVFQLTNDMNIPAGNVHFVGRNDKLVVAKNLGLDVYFDDSDAEIHRFNYDRQYNGGHCLGVCVNYTMNTGD